MNTVEGILVSALMAPEPFSSEAQRNVNPRMENPNGAPQRRMGVEAGDTQADLASATPAALARGGR